jgi:hypothetical protein
MNPFTLQFQLGYDEYRAVVDAGRRSQHTRKRTKVLLVVAVCFAALSGVVTMLVAPPSNATGSTQSNWLTNVAPWIVVFLIIWVFVFRIIRGGLRKQWEDLTLLHLPRAIEFRDDGITVHAPGMRLDYHWASVRDLAEATTVFVLHMADGTWQAIPKRAFAAPPYAEQFRAYVFARLGGRHLAPTNQAPG